MKKILTFISSLSLIFLFSFSLASASSTTNLTVSDSNVALSSCPTGQQPVFNVGGPICMVVYTPNSSLPPGCTPDEANDILSSACHPELHWSYQLPNQPLTVAQALQDSAGSGHQVSPANQQWILCTDNTHGCTGPGTWYWNGTGAPPASGPPDTADPYHDCAAAQAVQSGAPVTLLTSNGPVTASPVVVANSSFQASLQNACSNANSSGSGGSNSGVGTTGGGNNSGSSGSVSGSSSSGNSSNPLVITSSSEAMTKVYNAIYGTTQGVVQNALLNYLQTTGLSPSSSSLTAGLAGKSAGTTGGATANAACYQFTQALQLGSTGADILPLQKALVADGELTSVSNSTSFDTTIQAAVTAFQEKYADNILTPLGLTQGTGVVATRTRAELNLLCLVPSSTTNTAPATGATTGDTPSIAGVQGFDKSTNTYTAGIALPNTYLVLYGTFLSSGNAAYIDDSPANLIFQSTNQLNISLAGIANGTHTVRITSIGKSVVASFTISPSTSGSFSITLSPSSGPSGSGLNIMGTNFPLYNQVSFGTVEKNATYYSTSNGTVISLIVPFLNNNGFFSGTSLPNGQYPVTVSNANGTSIPVMFTITGGTTAAPSTTMTN